MADPAAWDQPGAPAACGTAAASRQRLPGEGPGSGQDFLPAEWWGPAADGYEAEPSPQPWAQQADGASWQPGNMSVQEAAAQGAAWGRAYAAWSQALQLQQQQQLWPQERQRPAVAGALAPSTPQWSGWGASPTWAPWASGSSPASGASTAPAGFSDLDRRQDTGPSRADGRRPDQPEAQRRAPGAPMAMAARSLPLQPGQRPRSHARGTRWRAALRRPCRTS
ncbi:unnamed protein product [Prorocentrum cordatum]|uniref:Uncharacterized protein n=1 Tax=Prorocentrum cordatum TaxID=2364126 RepID=A0ABN9W6G1_9DINO|nr:unnamed protein product [Polarella glacialis]